eukprot:318399-Prorocentrum_lima.AAC.1
MGTTTQHRTDHVPTLSQHGNASNNGTANTEIPQEWGNGQSNDSTTHHANFRDRRDSTTTGRRAISRRKLHNTNPPRT